MINSPYSTLFRSSTGLTSLTTSTASTYGSTIGSQTTTLGGGISSSFSSSVGPIVRFLLTKVTFPFLIYAAFTGTITSTTGFSNLTLLNSLIQSINSGLTFTYSVNFSSVNHPFLNLFVCKSYTESINIFTPFAFQYFDCGSYFF